jgi:hypothetical protein
MSFHQPQHLLSPAAVLQSFGVLGSSVGGAVEVEGEPGLSLSLAALPGCELSVMHTLRSSIPTEGAPGGLGGPCGAAAAAHHWQHL